MTYTTPHDTHLGVDYYAHGLRQYSNLAIQRPNPEGLFARLAELSTICRLAKVLSGKQKPARAENPAYPPPDPTGDPLPIHLWIDSMFGISGRWKALAHHHGAFVLFVPQRWRNCRV